MKVAGVVVLYNPDIDKVFSNTLSYIEPLEKLYIVDNSEKSNKKEIEKKYSDFLNKIEYTWFGENKGIAKALNEGKNRAIIENFEYLLTMDQDSCFKENFELFFKEIKDNKVILKNCVIISPYHVLKYDKKILVEGQEKISFVDSVMTSGNIINLKLSKKIGDFKEKLFIDEVDHEYCYRIRKNKLKIAKLNDIKMEHNLGEITKKFFIKSTNHNFIRRYYITRNKLYMQSKYPNLRKDYLISILKDFIKILLVEKDKLRKIKMIYYGYKDYKNDIYGKISNEYLK